ncbi:MAG: hypothetical protein ACPG8W_01645 [Candidatus Promineifilaceae bacterium]
MKKKLFKCVKNDHVICVERSEDSANVYLRMPITVGQASDLVKRLMEDGLVEEFHSGKKDSKGISLEWSATTTTYA